MKAFEHINATSVREAVTLLGEGDLSVPIAGGTDLLARMKLGLSEPTRLVNLKTIRGLDEISFDETDGLRLGALATLSDIASDKAVKTRYPALSHAIDRVASPQLRNFATIGGSLMQESRCWYYRGDFHCWLKGGEKCFAHGGENRLHAIFSDGPCYTIHPSDTATILTALGAKVSIAGRRGTSHISIDKFFQQPSSAARQLTILAQNEVLTGVRVPVPAPDSRMVYFKTMERRVWSFALASAAIVLTMEGNIVKEGKVVLGGVATMPWPVPETASVLTGQRLTDEVIDRASQAAILGAKPLTKNGYKVELIKGILTQALTELKG
jgi:xanthine dehydrogenase YagS FAD-binding subunit